MRSMYKSYFTNIFCGSWVLEVPTWPIEWQQMSALLAYHDFMETGAPDLFRTYENRLYNRTNIGAVDSTGLLNTSKGRHIVVSVAYQMASVRYSVCFYKTQAHTSI